MKWTRLLSLPQDWLPELVNGRRNQLDMATATSEGYAKRFGASYLDAFDGSMIGDALLPSLHQAIRN